MSGKDFCPIVNNCVLAAGIACILYYIGCGLFVRFGQSLLWIWPVAGVILIARYFLARAGIIAMIPRGLLITARTCIALAAAFFLLVQGVIVSAMVTSPPSGLDYIVVLGARVNGRTPSGALRNRIQAAADYLAANPATRAVLSGGQGAGEEISEAQCMYDRLVAAGVDPARLTLEDRSTDTSENLRFSRPHIPEGASVGLVTNNFHIFRALALARGLGWQGVQGVPVATTAISFPHYFMREFVGVVYDGLRGNLSL